MKLIVEIELPENMTAMRLNDMIAGVVKVASIWEAPVRRVEVMLGLIGQPNMAFLREKAE